MSRFTRNFSSLLKSQADRQVFVDRKLHKFAFSKMPYYLFFGVNFALLYYYAKKDERFGIKLSTSRFVSRMTGHVATVPVPQILRKPLFGLYASLYNVHLDEMENEIDSFETFSKFFTRSIKPRPIDPNPLSLASPADSRILTFSEVTGDGVLIVKGIEYKLGELLTGVKSYQIRDEVLNSMKKNPNNKLYQIILYLAPGDYHRFHSPAVCTFKTRNHIIGDLVPVKEQYVKTHAGVYEKNERVNIFGDWVKGFMCMSFVGALNVGSIDLNFDSDLKTNRKVGFTFQPTNVKMYNEGEVAESAIVAAESTLVPGKGTGKGIDLGKGEEIGRFNLGSTVVMVFEASPEWEWKVQPGEAVKYGQPLGVSK